MPRIAILRCFGFVLILCAAACRAEEPASGSQLTADEVQSVLSVHNRLREAAGVGPLTWSPKLAEHAQQWADHLAITGRFEHRPASGPNGRVYGENLATGSGAGFDATAGVQLWADERKFYLQGTAIPADFANFKAGHYTQMVWRDTTQVGIGKATAAVGPRKGWVIVVGSYDPAGNMIGEKPY